jgi:hypothetical protein
MHYTLLLLNYMTTATAANEICVKENIKPLLLLFTIKPESDALLLFIILIIKID